MFNLNDIIQNAQGGQAIGNLAQQFGLTPQQAQAAVSSLLPGLSMGINNAAQSPGGLGGILGQLLNGANTDAFHHPDVAATTGAQHGGDILGQIFGGGGNVLSQMTQHASQVSGVNAGTLSQMLPALISMIMGGLSHSMQNQGMGGILGQLAGAVLRGGGAGGLGGALGGGQQQAGGGGMGGLGDILGQVLGGGHMQPQQQPQGGGIGDLLGSIFGGTPAQQQPQGGGLGGGLGNIFPQGSQQPGMQGQAMQLGLETLSKMFQHGTQIQQEHHSGLQDIFAQMLGGKR
jgi:hypothetical protein